MKPRRYDVLDIWCDAVGMQDVLNHVDQFVTHGQRVHTVFASNPEKNFSVPGDPLLYEMFKNADLLIPDGIGMVMALRLLYGVRVERVPGCELMQRICGLAEQKGYSIYLYGAKEEVSLAASQTLTRMYPNLHIAGRSNGYVPPEKMDELVDDINESGAGILFLALGSPRQEAWISKHSHKLASVRVCQGIGGTLDVLSGNVKRAPKVFCKTGLEWFYRLLSDPRRLKRQKVLPVFLFRILVQRIKGA